MIRVFISHKREDDLPARRLALRLSQHPEVSTYLDTQDEFLNGSLDDLTTHLRTAMGGCTHLMAVVSRQTQASWWVPFEIGIATEKGHGISTLALDAIDLPSYLKRWPYLETDNDIRIYLEVALSQESLVASGSISKAASDERRSYAASFHTVLKGRLGQSAS